MRKYNYDNSRKNASRCGHPWCSECRKRRGSNRGNRNLRHRIKNLLKTGKAVE